MVNVLEEARAKLLVHFNHGTDCVTNNLFKFIISHLKIIAYTALSQNTHIIFPFPPFPFFHFTHLRDLICDMQR